MQINPRNPLLPHHRLARYRVVSLLINITLPVVVGIVVYQVATVEVPWVVGAYDTGVLL
jgi:hypothetical protein